MRQAIGFVAIAVILQTASAQSATLRNVPADFATIQAAINASADLDTVLVAPGNYTENLNFGTRTIRVLSSGGAAVTVLQPALPSTTLVSFAGGGSGTEFAGFTLDGGDMQHVVGIFSGSPWIHHNVVQNHISYVANATEVGSYSSDPIISNNLFIHNRSIGGVGIFTGGGQILNNTFHDCSRGYWSQGTGVIAKNNVVTNSVQFGIAGDVGFAVSDYNCVMNNNPNYDYGATPSPNDIQVWPVYCDSSADDYALDAISPCVSSGEGGANRGAFGVGCGTEPGPRALSLTIPGGIEGRITDATPDIMWTYFDPVGNPQAESEIEVGTDSDWTVAEMWDPAPFPGAATAQTYAGADLVGGTEYFVRVRVNNGIEWGPWGTIGFLFRPVSVLDVPDDYPSIQSAIDAAIAGDTVLVAPGTYIENISLLGKQIRVIGSGGALVTTLSPASPGATLVLIANGEPSGTELAGFTFSGGNMQHVIVVSGGSEPWIHHCVVRNHVSYENNATEIALHASSPVIEYNLFVHNRSIGGIGVFSGGGQILNNTFHDCSRGYWSQGNGVIAKNNIVTNSVQFGIGDDGFAVSDYNCVFNNNPDYDYGASAGTNDFSEFPEYCDSSADDFGLDAMSPCIGAGEGGSTVGAFGIACGEGAGPRVLVLTLAGSAPANVTDHTPDITWTYFDDGAMPQTEAEIEVGTNADWTVAEMWDPAPFVGSGVVQTYAGNALIDGVTYFLRVRVNNGTVWGPWKARTFHMNTPPPAPVLVSPADSGIVTSSSPALYAAAGVDVEGDMQTFTYEVYADEALTTLVAAESNHSSPWNVSPSLTLENLPHWWRARANDGFEDGPWSSARTFVLDAMDSPPVPGQLLTPIGNVAVPSTAPFFDWNEGVDPDPSPDAISQTLFIATDSQFVFSVQWANLPMSEFVYSGLSVSQRYWWKVRFTENDGQWSESSAERFFIPGPGDMNMNNSLNLVDVVMLIDVIFRGAPVPESQYLVDVNGDCDLNVADVVTLIGHVFRGGPLPLSVCVPPTTALRVPTQYPTITAAIGAATDDDTILVAAGTFVDNLDFMGKRVSLLSEDGPQVTTLVPAVAGQPTIKFVNGEDGTEVAGFTLTGGDGQHAILITNNSTPNIHHNIIRDHISYAYNATAIGSYGSSPMIEFNLFYHTRSLGGIGIFSGGGTIQNNTFDDNSRGYWSQGLGVIARNNIVTNSTDFGIGDDGFAVNDYNCTYNNNSEYCCGAVPGPNDFTADPSYCNPGGFNYNLAPGSICIMSGYGGVNRGAFAAGCLVR